MKKYLLVGIGLLLILSFAFAACAPAAEEPMETDQEETTAEEEEEEEPAEDTSMEPVTLSFLTIADDLQAQAMDQIVQRFHEMEDGKYAHITIEFDAKPTAEIRNQLQNAVAAGLPLDIIQVDGPEVKHYAYHNLLKDLSGDLTDEEMAQWVPQSVEEGSLGDAFYAPPMRQSCSIMWYNPDVTDAAGIDVPNTLEEAWTYEEALDAWQKTTIDEDGDGVPEVWGVILGQGPYWGDYEYDLIARSAGEPGSPSFEGIAPDGVTFDGYFNTDERVEAFEFAEALYQDYKVSPTEPIWDQFFVGGVAFQIYPDRLLGQIANQYPDAPVAAAPPPYVETMICHTGSWHYAIASTTEHYEEALAFVKFATSDEGAQIYWDVYGMQPPNVSLMNTLPIYQEYPRSLLVDMFTQYGVPRRQTPAYQEYNTLFVEFYIALINGTAEGDVKGLVDEYTQLFEDAAAKYSGWNE